MPQPRSSSSGSKRSSTSASKRSSGGASTSASKRSSSGASKRSSSSTGRRSSTSTARTRSTAGGRTSRRSSSSSSPDARFDAVAQRLRKLNERIIEAGKEAGETTLSSYEKALKAIASSIESGPGKSEVDWISHLATTQAKFLRDVTNAWTAAARGVLK
ncbi:MAG: hypothetical protein M3071_19915 [Actinomycetota bacterium]|nr:hypothetical protein [Actinomycetota bacterium]